MDDLIYSFSRPKNSTFIGKMEIEEEISLDELLEKRKTLNAEEIILGHCWHLKNILQIEDLETLFSEILKLEDLIKKCAQLYISHSQESNNLAIAEELPSIEVLYQKLAPLLLRAMIDERDGKERLKAAVRVAIEEELYAWKERNLGRPA